MNKIYNTDGSGPLTDEQIQQCTFDFFKAGHFHLHPIIKNMRPSQWAEQTVQGLGHCECVENGEQMGEFVLMPMTSCLPPYSEGGKWYMQCRKCGCFSHL